MGRKAAVPGLREFFEGVVMQAIEQEIAVKDRHTLAVALGRLGDPRIVADLRVKGHPDEHGGYVRIPAGDYGTVVTGSHFASTSHSGCHAIP